MSGQKCGAVAFEMNEVHQSAGRRLKLLIQKWVVESDRKMDTSVWLTCDKVDCEYVVTLKCCVSAEVNEKLQGMCIYNPA